MNVLVTGFGSFPGVADNPTAKLAISVDGRRIGDATLIGRVLPVSYVRGPALAIALAREHDVQLVVGLGVAVSRERVCVERVAVRVEAGMPDVDGTVQTGLVGPEQIRATLDTTSLADALGADLSDDAGQYVCNAWLYQVASALGVPTGFVHVPAAGLAVERLLDGISRLIVRP